MYTITLVDILKLLFILFPIYLFIYTIAIAIQGYSILKFRYYYPLIVFFSIAYLGYGILFLIFGDRPLDITILIIIGAIITIVEFVISFKTIKRKGKLILNLGLVDEKGMYKRGIWRSRVWLQLTKNGVCYSSDFFLWNKIIDYKWLGSRADILEFRVQSLMHPFPFKVIIPWQHLEEVEKVLTTYLPNKKI